MQCTSISVVLGMVCLVGCGDGTALGPETRTTRSGRSSSDTEKTEPTAQRGAFEDTEDESSNDLPTTDTPTPTAMDSPPFAVEPAEDLTHCTTEPSWSYRAESYSPTPDSWLSFQGDGSQLVWHAIDYSLRATVVEPETGALLKAFTLTNPEDREQADWSIHPELQLKHVVRDESIDAWHGSRWFQVNLDAVPNARSQLVFSEELNGTLVANRRSDGPPHLTGIDERGNPIFGPVSLGETELPSKMFVRGNSAFVAIETRLVRWNLQSAVAEQEIELPSRVLNLATDPSGSWLAVQLDVPTPSTTTQAELWLFDATTFATLTGPLTSAQSVTNQRVYAWGAAVAPLAVHSSGAVAYFDESLDLVWLTAADRQLAVLESREQWAARTTSPAPDDELPTMLRFSPDERLLARVRGSELSVFSCSE